MRSTLAFEGHHQRVTQHHPIRNFGKYQKSYHAEFEAKNMLNDIDAKKIQIDAVPVDTWQLIYN